MTLIITPSSQPNSSTSAQFRAWGVIVGNALLGLGLARSTDVGAINWTTVIAPTVDQTSAGWEIFMFQDALQATHPVFIKMEYGVCSQFAPGGAALWMTVGSGSDGAGNLTGQVGARMSVTGEGGVLTPSTSYFSGGPNRFVFLQWGSYAASNRFYCPFASVERTHNSAGGDTGVGVIAMAGGDFGGPYNQFIPSSGAVPAARTDWATVMPNATTSASGNSVYLYPIRIWANLAESSPSLNVFLYFGPDLTASNPVSVNCWDGNTHTVNPLGFPGQAGNGILPTAFGASNPFIGMRWD